LVYWSFYVGILVILRWYLDHFTLVSQKIYLGILVDLRWYLGQSTMVNLIDYYFLIFQIPQFPFPLPPTAFHIWSSLRCHNIISPRECVKM
jgi:hypothetical protein